MARFNKLKYHEEMCEMLRKAKRRWLEQHPDVQIYTISIWTDPDAAISAVSFDTLEQAQLTLARGDTELAPFLMGHAGNPADFAFTNFTMIEHSSFKSRWEELSDGSCWTLLDLALQAVAQVALQEFRDLPLHPEAELAINSQQDWYHHTWSFPSTGATL